MKRFALLTAAFFSLATSAFAGEITIDAAWARASAGMVKNGAAFVTIHNKGAADNLIGAKADISSRVELHTHIHDNGVMKMRKVDTITVPADGMAMLKPSGDHVMFMGLKEPLKEGTMFPLTLVFEKAGEQTVQVHVKKVGAMGDAHKAH